MKIRTDFVTNSSGSNFILGFNSLQEIETYRKIVGKRVIEKIKENIVEEEQYKDLCDTYISCLNYPWSFNYNGRNYWELSEEEKESPEFQEALNRAAEEIEKDLMEKLEQYPIVSLVMLSDNYSNDLNLINNVMPDLDCLIADYKL